MACRKVPTSRTGRVNTAYILRAPTSCTPTAEAAHSPLSSPFAHVHSTPPPPHLAHPHPLLRPHLSLCPCTEQWLRHRQHSALKAPHKRRTFRKSFSCHVVCSVLSTCKMSSISPLCCQDQGSRPLPPTSCPSPALLTSAVNPSSDLTTLHVRAWFYGSPLSPYMHVHIRISFGINSYRGYKVIRRLFLETDWI